jgi:hypothetical protein
MAIERDLGQSGRTALVDRTDARNIPASSARRIAKSFMLEGEKPTNRSQSGAFPEISSGRQDGY